MLKDNQILLKTLQSLMSQPSFIKTAQSKGEMHNSYVTSIINYIIATRNFPTAAFYEKIATAENALDYAAITAECIYQELGRQAEADGFLTRPAGIYTRFARNYYKYGLLFSAHKKSHRSYIDFPYKFKILAETQPENSVVKAYTYSLAKGKESYFSPSPAVALDFATKYAGFWSVMLNGQHLNDKSADEVHQFLHSAVADLDLPTEDKKLLFNDICESFDNFRATKTIELLMVDRDFAYNWPACNLRGEERGTNYGALEPCDDYYDVLTKYQKGANPENIVLSEIEAVGLLPFTFYCKAPTARVQKIGTNVDLVLPEPAAQQEK